MEVRIVSDLKESVDLLFNSSKKEKIDREKFKFSEKIYGRLSSWKENSHREHLIRDSVKPLTFAFGSDALNHFFRFELSVKQMLVDLGLTEQYITKKISEGWNFDMILFHDSEQVKPVPATWEGVGDLLSRRDGMFPDFADEMFKKYFEALKTTKYEDIPNTKEFFKIWESKRTHPKYIEMMKLMDGKKRDQFSLTDIRLYLYIELALGDLFDGSGYTIDEKTRKRGFKEYFVRNVKRYEIAESSVVVTLDF